MRWNPKIGTSSQEGDMDVRWMSILEGEATGSLKIDHFIKKGDMEAPVERMTDVGEEGVHLSCDKESKDRYFIEEGDMDAPVELMYADVRGKRWNPL